MVFTKDMLERVVAGGESAAGTITSDDAARIVEIACMTVASDGTIAPEELAAARTLGTAVRTLVAGGVASPLSANDLDAVVSRCNDMPVEEERLEHLRKVAVGLSSARARQLAYKVSMAVAMSDLASSDEEFEFDIALLDALDLGSDVGDRLAGEVHEALTVD